jgi:hypothetical protein
MIFAPLVCAGAIGSREQVQRAPAAAAGKCSGCHDAASLTGATSRYFEHYRTVHREAFGRKLDCTACHQPFYHENKTRVSASRCAECHGAEKKRVRIDAAVAHAAHSSQSGISCSACHKGMKHRIDRVQLLDACIRCH